jgi:hypothetical protein
LDSPLPEHLRRVNVFDVDYVWGQAESTHGMLWVVGRDPALFDYFIPERWRHTPRKKLSETAQTYHTVSKDHVRLVWKVSRVGEAPEADAGSHGYNSPFEEFAIAMELNKKGFSVVYPRAIYMSGLESPRAQEYVTDSSRFQSHERLHAPNGRPILRREHNYITIWGLWQGQIDAPGANGLPTCTGVNLAQACRNGLISETDLRALLKRKTARLEAVGFRTNLKPTHFLLSSQADGSLRRDGNGALVVTLCNFELLQRIKPAPGPQNG